MILRAQDYPALEGTPIAEMSMMAVHGDKLVPIPFQVDEKRGRKLAPFFHLRWYFSGNEFCRAAFEKRIRGQHTILAG